ncbi:uncharacterized protein LOC132562451 [Ylistrum balloti]|uniref:uncharacterized protein LOC132562451 n=1 Tax=Ylistrum balloti TaxID=509963 RepID=UPI0029058BF8|nr:uncharacterized protein LOC132562451 [Ylistrum balloti]
MKERQLATKEGKECYRCGGKGHFQRDCSSGRSRSPTSPSRPHSPRHDIKITRASRTGKSIVVPIIVNGEPTEAVIDTGADATVISDRWAKEVGLKYEKPGTEINLLTAEDGAQMTGVGVVTATLQLGEEVKKLPVVIAPIRDNMLVGIDLLQSVLAVIHTGEKNIEVSGKLLPGFSQMADTDIARSVVRVDASVVIPPGSEKMIVSRLENPSQPSQAILETFNHQSGLQIGSCLVCMNQTVPVRVLNLKDCEIKLSESTFLGKVEEVDVDQKFNNAEAVFPIAETKHLQNSVGVDICVPLHLQDLFSESSNGLTNPQRQRLCMLLKEFPDIFAKDDYDLGTFSGVKHRIDTGEAMPIRQPARRTPLGFQGEEDSHLQKLMETGVVIPSSSEWASPVVLVRKKDGGVRWCVDYRKVSEVSVKDAYPRLKIVLNIHVEGV